MSTPPAPHQPIGACLLQLLCHEANSMAPLASTTHCCSFSPSRLALGRTAMAKDGPRALRERSAHDPDLFNRAIKRLTIAVFVMLALKRMGGRLAA